MGEPAMLGSVVAGPSSQPALVVEPLPRRGPVDGFHRAGLDGLGAAVVTAGRRFTGLTSSHEDPTIATTTSTPGDRGGLVGRNRSQLDVPVEGQTGRNQPLVRGRRQESSARGKEHDSAGLIRSPSPTTAGSDVLQVIRSRHRAPHADHRAQLSHRRAINDLRVFSIDHIISTEHAADSASLVALGHPGPRLPVDAVAADVMGSVDDSDVVLVGHSVAGTVLPSIAARLGHRVIRLVFIAGITAHRGRGPHDRQAVAASGHGGRCRRRHR